MNIVGSVGQVDMGGAGKRDCDIAFLEQLLRPNVRKVNLSRVIINYINGIHD